MLKSNEKTVEPSGVSYLFQQAMRCRVVIPSRGLVKFQNAYRKLLRYISAYHFYSGRKTVLGNSNVQLDQKTINLTMPKS